MCDKRISIVGAGMGTADQLTGLGSRRLREAQAVVGAPRLTEGLSGELAGHAVLASHRTGEIVEFLKNEKWTRAVFLVSGDTGFYSAASGAAAAFEEQGWETELVPGISSMSWFAARLGKNWQNMAVLSCHGRDVDPAGWVRSHGESFLLLGGKIGVRELCAALLEGGLSDCRLWIGENLAAAEERIEAGSPEQILLSDTNRPFGSLCCAVAENTRAVNAAFCSFGLPDSAFVRGKVPMTKSEVRALSLTKLGLRPGAVCFDVGSGTGSVSVEMGLALKSWGAGAVYAVEKKEEALELTRINGERFLGNWKGFHVVPGSAPEAFAGLPAPTHVFVGGSGGELLPVVEQVLEKAPGARIVVNAVTPETVAELLQCRKRFRFAVWEMIQVRVDTFRAAGNYHMPCAGNPVCIALMQNPQRGEDGL